MLCHSSSQSVQLQGLLRHAAVASSSSCSPGVLQQLTAWAACKALTRSVSAIQQPCSSQFAGTRRSSGGAEHHHQQQQQRAQHMPHVARLQQPSRCLPLSQAASHIHPGWSQHTTAYPTGSSSGSSGSNQTIAQAASAQTNQASGSQTMKRPSGKLQHVFSKGQVLGDGRYKLLELVAADVPSPVRGKPVTLWRGKDLETRRGVMIKCMEAGDTASYAAGMREAALHAAAGRCPNIVALTDAFEHRSSSGRHPVTVWSPVGDTLSSVAQQYSCTLGKYVTARTDRVIQGGICDRKPPLRKLAQDLLTALDFLHRCGLVHTNLCLDNVVLDRKFMSGQQLRSETRVPWYESMRLDLLQKRSWWAREISGNDRKSLRLSLQLEEQVMAHLAFQVEMLNVHFEGSLSAARFRLRDLSQAVALTGQLPFCPSGQQVNAGAQALLQRPQLFCADGSPVQRDPDYQAPEEVLGMRYLAPSYDMWKFGCLMFEAATNRKLFSGERLRDEVQKEDVDLGYSDQHWLLADMVEKLGHIPRVFGLKAPLRAQFFYRSSAQYDPYADMLKIHAGPLKHFAGRKPLVELVRAQTVLDDHLRFTQALTYLVTTERSPEECKLSSTEAEEFAGFLSEVLRWTPESRATAADLLKHPWLQKDDGSLEAEW